MNVPLFYCRSNIEHLIESILSVVSIQKTNASHELKTIKATSDSELDLKPFFASIKLISSLASSALSRANIADESKVLLNNTVQLLGSIKRVSLHVSSQKSESLPVSKSKSLYLFEALDKDTDENFHSDYLAALLNTKLMGQFSHDMLLHLLSRAGATDNSIDVTKPIYVAREKRLDQIDDTLQGSEIGARRIDLYIRHSNFILIIENKLYTSESESQTTDYFSVTKKANPNSIVLGLLLSPDGQKPQEKSFYSLSYRELIFIMHECKDVIENENMKMFFHLYFDSLRRQFIESDREYHIRIENFWRKAS